MASHEESRSNNATRRHAPQVCVWVSAGLLTYRLCDRDFECDSCPLDAALTGSHMPAGGVRVSGPTVPLWSLHEDRQYSAGHMWVLPMASALMRIGIDAFAAKLLARIQGISLPDSRAVLQRGRMACVVEIAGGKVPLCSPVSGRVIKVNETLRHFPDRLIGDPYASGWICDVRGLPEEESLFDASEARRRLGYDLEHFRSRVASHLLAERSRVGPVMADGGEPLTDLQEILGFDRFLALLCETLSG